ncbi:hypothetical protein GCM10017056_49780 [Seohaeicola zhoushanensis]|uniref:Uncharacterized protein n=1 Tax=Seohaeicola zhoushanensis TaxID=1569283 RepID=A0A8J3H3D1_9RHOB|nr:hypothetical protein GCM10017056_49780 [Seohaeicola zhoushanensis]
MQRLQSLGHLRGQRQEQAKVETAPLDHRGKRRAWRFLHVQPGAVGYDLDVDRKGNKPLRQLLQRRETRTPACARTGGPERFPGKGSCASFGDANLRASGLARSI